MSLFCCLNLNDEGTTHSKLLEHDFKIDSNSSRKTETQAGIPIFIYFRRPFIFETLFFVNLP